MPEYKITCTGGIDVDPTHKPIKDYIGDIVGFKTKSGLRVDLYIGLRVTSKDGSLDRYLSSDHEFEQFGFANLDYDKLEFSE